MREADQWPGICGVESGFGLHDALLEPGLRVIELRCHEALPGALLDVPGRLRYPGLQEIIIQQDSCATIDSPGFSIGSTRRSLASGWMTRVVSSRAS